MPLDIPDTPLADRVEAWNRALEGADPAEVVRFAMTAPEIGRMAAVSSFGADSIALLHMIARAGPGLPILFLDTGMLFPETLAYQRAVAAHLGLMDVRVIQPDRLELFKRDPDGVLHVMDPDACCRLRKVEPLEKALRGFDAWITGRKRFQGGRRATLQLFEIENGRVKVNPLAHWSPDEVQGYIGAHALPRHPLAGKSLPSLGCLPCTSEVAAGEDARAGRWRGREKDECGIHFVDGKVVRGGAAGPDRQGAVE
ncbi:Phosphoadenylyl-sulfate reductase [Candidatus Rhodobacter oscarellae]|uniref:Adenosine 5'-phosphosulfate reductase n=1 Tax=Candidatus Rhodobacter oscarellae TaxID=1675527 RepID=A0A0J9E4B8_9RHOB|nr:phosphoadenylyl-sulfate reductase [Candidatus Rhodobacter lobularis]KMW56694.1 Phosphoadenylyl-sulfate reductase [Candidatus Rhodobacter lobularis]